MNHPIHIRQNTKEKTRYLKGKFKRKFKTKFKIIFQRKFKRKEIQKKIQNENSYKLFENSCIAIYTPLTFIGQRYI